MMNSRLLSITPEAYQHLLVNPANLVCIGKNSIRHQMRNRAFTIIELLVAMGIATLMGFLINLIFIEATDAVSRGIATSKVINNSRTLGDQLEADFEHQLRPDLDDGVLVILNRRINGIPMLDAQRGGRIDTSVRSDQLSFIYDNLANTKDSYEPITPGTLSNFQNNSTANYLRIWYGHALKTKSNGIAPDTLDFGFDENRYANDWVLGRQALFFDGEASTNVNIYALGSASNAGVSGYSSDIDGSISQVLRSGLTDVAYASFNSDTNTAGAPLPGGLERLMVSDTHNYAVLQDIALGTQTDAQYQTNAMEFLAFPAEHLQCNPFPGSTSFYSSQVAQMHAYFMEHVSDFIVEFAADAANDPLIASFPDNEPDRDGSGAIRWYSIDDPPAWDVSYTYNPTSATGPYAFADAAWVFRHDYKDNWPYLIRIRCRMHDARGSLTDSNDNYVTNGIDDDGYNTDDDNDSLIDEADEVDEEDEITLPGLWFEFIVKVNRS